MPNPRRAPVGDRVIDAGELRQMVSARFPLRRVIGLRPVIKIAQIMQGDFIAVNVRQGAARYIGLPRLISSWLEGEPPSQDSGKANHDQSRRAPEPEEK